MTLTLPDSHEHANGRTCTECGEFKSIDHFGLSREPRSVGGISVRSKCKPCDRTQKIPGEIKRRYGITIEQYWQMHSDQDGGCAICGSETSNSSRSTKFLPLFIDHCHATGEVRGLLCHKCNQGLGFFNDSPDLLDQAIQYLLLTSMGQPSRATG